MFNYNAGGVGRKQRGKNHNSYNRVVCYHTHTITGGSFKYWPDN